MNARLWFVFPNLLSWIENNKIFWCWQRAVRFKQIRFGHLLLQNKKNNWEANVMLFYKILRGIWFRESGFVFFCFFSFFFAIIIVVVIGTECCQSYAWKQLGRYSGIWVEFSGPGDPEPRELLPHSLTRQWKYKSMHTYAVLQIWRFLISCSPVRIFPRGLCQYSRPTDFCPEFFSCAY